jgi:hypothetical protein
MTATVARGEATSGTVEFVGGVHTFNEQARFSGNQIFVDGAAISGDWYVELYFVSGELRDINIMGGGVMNFGWGLGLPAASPSLQGALVNNGTLNFFDQISFYSLPGASEELSFLNSGSINLEYSSVLDLVSTGIDFRQHSGEISLDDATFTVAYGRQILLDGGALKGAGRVVGDVVSNGSIMPGLGIGALHIDGSLVQMSDGLIGIEIGGRSIGEYDYLGVSGSADLNGLIGVSLVNGFMPVLGDSFTIANFGSRSGSAEYSGLRIDDDLSFVVEEKDDGLILKVVDTSLANDGTAVFSITGTPAVGHTLSAVRSADDPDGKGTDPIFSWQASSDGSIWSTIGSNSSSYTVSPADLGRALRLQVSYADAEGFAESLTIPYGRLEELPATADGTRFTVNDPLSPDLQITSQGSPDLVELQAAVSATLHARTSSTWSSGFVAYNAGSLTAPGTGERIPVTGLGRYSFVATAIPEATTAIVLEPDQNSAYFLHDTYSAFFSGLSLELDSYGRASAQRLLNIDTITMGSAGGTSIVDLTSPGYITGSMTVLGPASGTSIVWGSDADDTYISAGSEAVIYGGLGSNIYTLGSGRETLQYRQMGGGIGATDQIRGFDPSIDRLQFWAATDQLPSTPSLANTLSSSLLAWGGHTIEFLDQPDLSLADLTILQATAI